MDSYIDELSNEKQEIKNIQKYANKFQLLNPADEIVLTRRIYDVRMALISTWITRFELHPLLLLRLVNSLCKDSAELVNKNLRLVLHSCQSPSYTGRGLPIIDLFMEGVDGLRYAANWKYNPYLVNPKTNRTNKFSTYATFWIKQRMGRAIENKGSSIKIAGHVHAVMSKIRQVVRKYVKDTKGQKPSPETIVDLLQARYPDNDAIKEITSERVSELGRLAWTAASLDEEVDTNEGSVTLLDYLESPESYQPEIEYEEIEKKDMIKAALDKLADDERLIVAYRFGIIDYVPRSPRQIAKLVGIPLKEVQKKLQSSIDRLKDLIDPEIY